MTTCERFSRTLRRFLAENDMSQAEAAKKTGLNERTIRNLASGHTRPSLKTAGIIADAIGIPLGEMVGEMISCKYIEEKIKKSHGPEHAYLQKLLDDWKERG